MKSVNLNFIKIMAIFVMGLKSVITIGISFIFSDFIIAIQDGEVELFYKTVMVFIVFLIFELLFDLIAIKLRMKYAQKSMININSSLFNQDINSKKDIDMASYSTKTELFVSNYLINQIVIPYYIIQITMAIIAYFIISPVYVVYMLCISGLMMVIPSFSAKKMGRLTKEYTDCSKGYINFLNNIFAGRREINQYNVTNKYQQKHNDEINNLFDKYEKYNTFLRYVNASSNSFFTITFIGLQIISGFLILFGDMEFGMLFTAIQLMNFFSNPLHMLFDAINKYNSIKEQVPDIKNYINIDNTSLEINEKIELNNLSFSYDDNDENKITYPNITFNKNKKYLITGKSGTGKSTLAKILSGEICDYNGEIVVDSNKENVLSSIIYVPQSAHLFYGSVEDNITLNRNLDNNNTKTAMELANVERDLLNKIIDVNSEVSGGEKARISLARSLACRPKIMIIDEPTANLDYKNSIDIMTKLCDIDDLTLIVISHETDDEFISCFDQVVNLI